MRVMMTMVMMVMMMMMMMMTPACDQRIAYRLRQRACRP
jgi:hypothetical protein